ncbi:MAG: thioredoxin-like domain-containing protein [Thermomicrobiales bacterium]
MPELYPGRVRAPEFPAGLQWLNSEPLSVASLRGKLVILDFWTTCCINCIHILPHLHHLAEELTPEVVVIGVHSPKFPAEEDPAFLEQSVLLNDITHPVVNDQTMEIWRQYGVNAWPSLIFIDPAGYVFARHAGEFQVGSMRNAITTLVAQYRKSGLIITTPLPTATRLPQPAGPLMFPGKVLADSQSSRLFIADSGHHQIVVSALDGTAPHRIGLGSPGFDDGASETATFRHPQGLALSPDRSTLFVADAGNHALRSLDPRSGAVSTLAGTGERGVADHAGPGLESGIASPWDLAWRGDLLWIAMAGLHQLWTFDPSTNIIAPAAGTGAESIHDGPLAESTFAQPMGIASADGILFVADSESSAVRRVDPSEDRVKRLIGRGLFHFGDLDARGDSARLQHVQGIAASSGPGGHVVYLADTYNNKIKRLDPLTRSVITIAGTDEAGFADGSGENARFSLPSGLSLAGNDLYIADTNNHAIRRLDLETGQVKTVIAESSRD